MNEAIPEVDVDRAEALLGDGALLLDVREPDEWEAGHASGATHVPLGQLEARRTELPVGRTIVCICRSGARSGRATRAMIGWGLDAVNVAGGMQGWAASGRSVLRDDDSAGFVA